MFRDRRPHQDGLWARFPETFLTAAKEHELGVSLQLLQPVMRQIEQASLWQRGSAFSRAGVY
jgi:hypothetical protein